MRYCFAFVCQAGELEPKALLLAASLRRHLRCEHELVAAIPQPESAWGKPGAATLDALRRMGVRFAAIENPIDPSYPIANKIACLGIETTADKRVFMDSDMLCLRDFAGPARFGEAAVNVKPGDLVGIASDLSQWDAAYQACGVTLPAWRVTATVSRQSMPPYFNAGFIACDRASGLAREWAECARAIDASAAVARKRPWLDQVALSVAIAKRGLSVDCLDERFNYPAHLRPLRGEAPYFCHYHYPQVIRREPRLLALFSSLLAEHPGIRAVLEAHAEWSMLLAPRAVEVREDTPAPELIVTGIPRSGTSYLCKLLHELGDCVIVNEPPEIFAPLQAHEIPHGVALYYRDLRRDVLDGKPIRNKLHNGEFIEDTARIDTVEEYRAVVTRPDFLVGTKNTLAYLARLPQVHRALPDAGIVACVRHPLDTIASWKSTFAHLANADLEGQVLGHSGDPMMSALQRERLAEMAATSHLPLRRALMWRYLAEIVLEHRDRIAVLRYEDVVADPAAAVRRVFAAVPGMFDAPMPAWKASSPRSNRAVLDAQDLAAIRGICAQTAADFGYEPF
ncbi:MAG TPA: sulfotransferase [Usitatibacter sp.]|nr:sulfotransferase [Usitatibacter sp.]